MLRRAINYGYEEASGAGRQTRRDRWRFGYQES